MVPTYCFSVNIVFYVFVLIKQNLQRRGLKYPYFGDSSIVTFFKDTFEIFPIFLYFPVAL